MICFIMIFQFLIYFVSPTSSNIQQFGVFRNSQRNSQILLQMNVILLHFMIKCYATYILITNFRRMCIHFAPFSKFILKDS